MALAIRNPGKVVSFIAAAAGLFDAAIVRVDPTTDCYVNFPAGAQPVTPLLGLVYAPGKYTTANVAVAYALGDEVDVVLDGIYPVLCDAVAITRGDEISSAGAGGTAATAIAAGGTNVGIIGVALASGVLGDLVPIVIRCYVKQG